MYEVNDEALELHTKLRLTSKGRIASAEEIDAFVALQDEAAEKVVPLIEDIGADVVLAALEKMGIIRVPRYCGVALETGEPWT